MKKQLHEFYVTRKCTKMEYFTVKAESMEEAEWEAENGNEYFDFDWEEFDFEIVDEFVKTKRSTGGFGHSGND